MTGIPANTRTVVEQHFSITRELTQVLDRLAVPYMVSGSVASSVVGEPRSTYDIDVIVDLAEHQVPALVAELQHDYYVPEEGLRQAVRIRGSCNVIHLATATKVGSNVAATTFTDTTATPNAFYVYWIVAKNDVGNESNRSLAAGGIAAPTLPAVPADVVASDDQADQGHDHERELEAAGPGPVGQHVVRLGRLGALGGRIVALCRRGLVHQELDSSMAGARPHHQPAGAAAVSGRSLASDGPLPLLAPSPLAAGARAGARGHRGDGEPRLLAAEPPGREA